MVQTLRGELQVQQTKIKGKCNVNTHDKSGTKQRKYSGNLHYHTYQENTKGKIMANIDFKLSAPPLGFLAVLKKIVSIKN